MGRVNEDTTEKAEAGHTVERQPKIAAERRARYPAVGVMLLLWMLAVACSFGWGQPPIRIVPTPVGLIETQFTLILAATQTEAARLTEVAALSTVMEADPTATAMLATAVVVENTPVPVLPTFTDTATLTETRPATATATPTPDPYAVALGAAEGFDGGNEDWKPVAWTFDDDPTGATMVLAPSGCFMMGSGVYDDEEPVHEQCFDGPFWIDETEVTRGQWQACADAGVCRVPPASYYPQSETQPMRRVTWYEAVTFCEWRGARLPTEREWEYAAAGPDGWVYPWGDDFNAELVVYSENSDQTADVGSRPGGASWVGALDMSGNVWEWVSSKYLLYPYAPDDGREDMTTSDDYRVLRGGSFNFGDFSLRAAYRYWYYPTVEFEFLSFGFRCARSP